MSRFIEFSDEQKKIANQVDLADFLRKQGESLEKSGKEFRWLKNTSVTIKGNRWFQHKYQEGGYPIKFLQKFFGYTYPEAVQCLLNESGVPYEQFKNTEEDKKEFHPPERNESQKRIYGYLLKQRCIDSKVLNEFVEKGLIYESAKYHNVVFAGFDEEGAMRHAHKKSTFSSGRSFRTNETGSDPRYSFHWNGISNKIYVFEAPIDMLSYISLHQQNWQENSYVALNGVSVQPLLHQLAVHSDIQKVVYCLDHDIAGNEAVSRIIDELQEHGYFLETMTECSTLKDWNEDLKQKHGLLNLTEGTDNPKEAMFYSFLNKYELDTEEKVQISNIMDEYISMFRALNDKEKEGCDTIRKCLCRLCTNALKYHEQISDIRIDKHELLRQSYHSHKDRGDLSKRIEMLKESIHRLKECYVNKKLDNRELYLQKRLLDVAEDCMLIVAYLDIQDELEIIKQEEMNMKQKRKPKCPLIGSDGNVFNLIGLTQKSLIAVNEDKLAKEMQDRVYRSGSYAEALNIMQEYVEVTSVDEFNVRIYRELDSLKRELVHSGRKDEVKDIAMDIMTAEDGEEAMEKLESYRKELLPSLDMRI